MVHHGIDRAASCVVTTTNEAPLKRLCLCLLLPQTACLSIDLTNRPCPCIDGYVCVDDVCVQPAGGSELCPAEFNDDDACTAAPPAAATLVAVCAQGDTFEEELLDAAGQGFGVCFGPPEAAASLVSESLTGSFTFVDAVLSVSLSGSTTWDVDIAESCVAGFGCQPATEGSCTAVDDGCACRGMPVELDIDEDLEQLSTLWTSNESNWRGCADGDLFLLRREEGSARGLTFVFRAD